MTYGVAAERRLNIGRGIMALWQDGALGPQGSGSNGRPELIDEKSGFGVGIWSSNRPEWQLVDAAAHAFSLVGIPLYDTLGPTVVEYVVNHAPLSIVFTAAKHIPQLLKVAKNCPCLRVVVSLDVLDDREAAVLKEWAESVGLQFWQLPDFEIFGAAEGAKRKIQVRPPTPEMTCTISYTSGTTGNPKGVVLTHEAVTKGAVATALGMGEGFSEQPVMISYLPLAHIFERFFELTMMYAEGCIGYTTGDPLRLLEDAQIIRPHFFPSVPRVLTRIHQAIMVQANAPGIKGALLTRAINTKLENYRKTGAITHSVYDTLIFRNIRNLLGGRVEMLVSGSAPIQAKVLEVMTVCFSCAVIEGYGLTESVGVCTANIDTDRKHLGSTGSARTGVQLRLADVPELNYLVSDKPDPRGEICIGGPILMSRYHRDLENTKKVIDEDGFFHTGDIGSIDSAGRLRIVDRIKNVMKLSQGEYVALEKVEGIFNIYPLFQTIYVHGDSLQSHIVLIGICDPIQAAQLVESLLGKKINPSDLESLKKSINDDKIRRKVLKDLKKLAQQAKLNG